MNVHIEVTLFDAAEVSILQGALGAIEGRRRTVYPAMIDEVMAPLTVSVTDGLGGTSWVKTTPAPPVSFTDGGQLNTPTDPALVLRNETVPVPTLAELETALRDFLARHGNDLAPARKVLDTFGLAKLSDAAGLIDIGRIELLEALTK